MEHQIPGIHHITAITGDPQQNVDFYVGILGLRLVKLTVNFDDPGAYHLYYGDSVGSPGTILTFFSWPGAPRGRLGAGQATAITFAIPRNSMGYWLDRLAANGVAAEGPAARFGAEVITFSDPDGLRLELVGHDAGGSTSVWDRSAIPAEHAIRRFYGVALTERQSEPTDALLAQVMGFQATAEEGERLRYRSDQHAAGAYVDVLRAPDAALGRVAVGTIHHVAWRTPTDNTQQDWLQTLQGKGFDVSPVMDRVYFHSIYFREPGGVLFEIATDTPGFTADETVEELGASLKLPPWLEPMRSQIEQALIPLRLPAAVGRGAR